MFPNTSQTCNEKKHQSDVLGQAHPGSAELLPISLRIKHYCVKPPGIGVICYAALSWQLTDIALLPEGQGRAVST